MKDYEYIIIDAQYFLVRNFQALKGRTKTSELRFLADGEGDTSMGYLVNTWDFTAQDLVKQFFWSVCKLIRDDFTCDKVILLWDKAPYHKMDILDNFKSDREYHSQDGLDDWDIDSDPEGYLQEKELVALESIKQTAKYWIINNLGEFGMPSVIHKGYEADDLAYILTHLELFLENTTRKSAICSADSDWMYWITGKFDFINFNKTEVWTVEDVIAECNNYPTELGLTLFETKKYMDSLFYSHNGLERTTSKTWKDFKSIVTHIKDENYSDLDDVERFHKNMKSFDIEAYPEFDIVRQKLIDSLIGGKLPSIDYWSTLSDKGFKVSRSYSETYLAQLTPEYYEQS